ncbi:MAG: hypothetical protein PHH36_09265 [Sideroxydans sp.]|nr:hypothetical protein [Sideroxydans sp.]
MEQPIYKYMMKRYALKLLRSGEIKIGTLHGYRNIELLGPEVGDSDEGLKYLFTTGHTVIDTAAPSDIPYFLKPHIHVSGENRLQITAAKGVSASVEEPDSYVFCGTYEFDPVAMKLLGYDACVKIISPSKFFHAITRKLALVSYFLGPTKVDYLGRRFEHSTDPGISPAFLKTPEYMHQKEIRVVWPSENTIIKPVVVTARKAAKVCEQIE